MKNLDNTAELVKLARCTTTCNEDIFRVQFNTFPKSQEVCDIISRLMKIDGGEVKTGAAPMGPRERRIMESLRGQKDEEEDEE